MIIESKFNNNADARLFYLQNKEVLRNLKNFANYSIFYIEKHYFDCFIKTNIFVKPIFYQFLEKFINQEFKNSLLKVKSKKNFYVFNYKNKTFIIHNNQFISFSNENKINSEFKKEFTFLFLLWFVKNKFEIQNTLHLKAINSIINQKNKLLTRTNIRGF